MRLNSDPPFSVTVLQADQIDSNFFSGLSLTAHVAGNKKLQGRLSDKNKNKRKLKKIYSELDPKRHGHT